MPPTDPPDFPWYGLANGRDLEQGDLLINCPRYVLPDLLPAGSPPVAVARNYVNAVVLTQSCDLAMRADGRCESPDVIRLAAR